jgi:hypothetical protein
MLNDEEALLFALRRMCDYAKYREFETVQMRTTDLDELLTYLEKYHLTAKPL